MPLPRSVKELTEPRVENESFHATVKLNAQLDIHVHKAHHTQF